eukprot:m.29382 g.29382  ORF g.29382 m.29382 type:complete len:64 (+) comp6147_c0_seq1:1499-1690(+)
MCVARRNGLISNQPLTLKIAFPLQRLDLHDILLTQHQSQWKVSAQTPSLGVVQQGVGTGLGGK